ncbi:MAG: BTAD domain-containing putative transcriptional regulator [Thiogranum sp.]
MATHPENRGIAEQPQQHTEHWSLPADRSEPECPVKIYTLGRFGMKLQQQSMVFSAARQQRALELLQALIAFGGRNVSIEHLSHALWPDADGDIAKNTFDVTLHRLRHFFEIKDILIVRERHLTLNNKLAWVDVWLLERLLNHCRPLLERAREPAAMYELARCSERMQLIYQGGFLEREPVRPWAISLRERLRSKVLFYLIDAGHAWETIGDTERAIRCYRKGLEIEPLAEELYQNLIRCYRDNQRMAEAMATFRRCKQVLTDQLQISPAPATLDLYATLKS